MSGLLSPSDVPLSGSMLFSSLKAQSSLRWSASQAAIPDPGLYSERIGHRSFEAVVEEGIGSGPPAAKCLHHLARSAASKPPEDNDVSLGCMAH